jgi:hypothetical protein
LATVVLTVVLATVIVASGAATTVTVAVAVAVVPAGLVTVSVYVVVVPGVTDFPTPEVTAPTLLLTLPVLPGAVPASNVAVRDEDEPTVTVAGLATNVVMVGASTTFTAFVPVEEVPAALVTMHCRVVAAPEDAVGVKVIEFVPAPVVMVPDVALQA